MKKTILAFRSIGLRGFGFGSRPATAQDAFARSATYRITGHRLPLLHENVCSIKKQLVAAVQVAPQLPWAQGQD